MLISPPALLAVRRRRESTLQTPSGRCRVRRSDPEEPEWEAVETVLEGEGEGAEESPVGRTYEGEVVRWLGSGAGFEGLCTLLLGVEGWK